MNKQLTVYKALKGSTRPPNSPDPYSIGHVGSSPINGGPLSCVCVSIGLIRDGASMDCSTRFGPQAVPEQYLWCGGMSGPAGEKWWSVVLMLWVIGV